MLAAFALLQSTPAVVPDHVGEDQGSYTKAMFAEAIADRYTTAQPFVLVTIVNGTTYKKQTGCVEVSSLAAAIALEHGWTDNRRKPTPADVDRMMLESKRRTFSFKTPRWLTGSGYYAIRSPSNQRACSLLRRGIPAFRADISGQVVAGTPGHSLAVLPPDDGN